MVALGACMVAPGGMRGCSGGACMVALGGACMVAPGGGMCGIRRDTDIRSMSGRYASYWNAFLLFLNFYLKGLSLGKSHVRDELSKS